MFSSFRRAIGSAVTTKYIEPANFISQKKQFFDPRNGPQNSAVSLNPEDGPKRKSIRVIKDPKIDERI